MRPSTQRIEKKEMLNSATPKNQPHRSKAMQNPSSARKSCKTRKIKFLREDTFRLLRNETKNDGMQSCTFVFYTRNLRFCAFALFCIISSLVPHVCSSTKCYRHEVSRNCNGFCRSQATRFFAGKFMVKNFFCTFFFCAFFFLFLFMV